MTTDRQLTGAVRSWLREEQHEDADRVLYAVLDQIGTTPQRRPDWLARRFPIMNSTKFRFGIGAVAALALAFAGWQFLPGARVGNGPSITPSPAQSATPLTSMLDGRKVDAGSYSLVRPGGIASTIQLPEGWWLSELNQGKFEIERRLTSGGPDVPADIRDAYNGALLELFVVDNIYADPCSDTEPMSPAIGPTVDDLVEALRNQGATELSSMRDVTIGGQPGKAFNMHNRRSAEGCVGDPWLWEWTYTSGEGKQGTLGGSEWKVTALDVNGQRLVAVEWLFEWTTAELEQEMDEIVASLRFD